MRTTSDHFPQTFLPLGDGSFHYNFNVEEKQLTREALEPEGKPEVQISYECDTVHFWGEPKYDTLVRAVIRTQYDETREFSLINKYNAYSLGLSDDPADKEEYVEFLEEVNRIKAMIKHDLAQY